MTSQVQFEARARDIIRGVLAGNRVEDDFVELKGVWVDDPPRTARLLAAHANTARGAPIMWIIGLDDGAGLVKSADIGEFSAWHAKVASWFNGPSPHVRHHFVVHMEDGATVVVIVFDTAAAPFVVKHPLFGNTKGAPEFEVPWRIGTAARSARREDLLRILVPLAELPDCDLLSCAMRPGGNEVLIEAMIYVASTSSKRLIIPFYKCRARFRVHGDADEPWFELATVTAQDSSAVTPTLRVGTSEWTIDGAARIWLRAVGNVSGSAFRNSRIEASIDIGSAASDRCVTLSCVLSGQSSGSHWWSRS